jgi:phosphoribosylaminoimidazole-succinocarboxamide synthase
LLYHPRKPLRDQRPMRILKDYPLRDSPGTIEKITKLARQNFIVLRDAWAALKATMYDLKIEVQLDANGEPMVSDVEDGDSWRVQDKKGNHLDKQPFRDGASLEEVKEIYASIAELTDQFVTMA